MLNENLGRLHFLLTFIGFNLCFAPQHWLGLNGMPRRVAEYDPQFALINQISSVGALLMAISTLALPVERVDECVQRRKLLETTPGGPDPRMAHQLSATGRELER
jgi:heme/copper-type cytochrome/quinol oxidase subunit 1